MKHSINPLLLTLLFSSVVHAMELERIKSQVKNAQGDSKSYLLKDALFDAMEKKIHHQRGTYERKQIATHIKFIREELGKLTQDQLALIQPVIAAYDGVDSDPEKTKGSYDPFNAKRQQCKKIEVMKNTKNEELTTLEKQATDLDAQVTILQKQQSELSKLYKSKKTEADLLHRAETALKVLQKKDFTELKQLERQKRDTLVKVEESLEQLNAADAKAKKNPDLTQRAQEVRKNNEQRENLLQQKTTLSTELIMHSNDILKMDQRLNPEKYPSVATKVTNVMLGTASVLKNVWSGNSIAQPIDEAPDAK